MVSALPKTPAPRAGIANVAATASDEQLIEGLAARDSALVPELHRRLLRTIDATLYRVFGRRDAEYEDLVQAALEQIVIALLRGKFSRVSSLATWASGVTSNVALRAIRRRKLEGRIFDHFAAPSEALRGQDSANPEAQVNARLNLQRLHAHLAGMSSKLSETLLLHDVLGFGLQETASMTGTSRAATRSRLVRGRHDLFHRLRNDGDLSSSRSR